MAALAPSSSESVTALAAARRLYLLFRIGEDRYALDAADVVEVLGLRALKQVPGTPPWVAGMLDRRGTPVPVIDMSALAGHGSAVTVTSTRLALEHGAEFVDQGHGSASPSRPPPDSGNRSARTVAGSRSPTLTACTMPRASLSTGPR